MSSTIKISTIDPNRQADAEEPATKASTASAPDAAKSSYAAAEEDPWKAMTETSLLGDMSDAINGAQEAAQRPKGPIETLLNGMVKNDEKEIRKKAKKDFDIPKVPMVHEILEGDPILMDDFGPIVDRFKVFIEMLKVKENVAEAALKKPMSASEIQVTLTYLKHVKAAQKVADEQFEIAKYYLEVQKVCEEAERENPSEEV